MKARQSMPKIPASEYPGRWEKVQELMEKKAWDLVVAYADDRATFGPAHARWLADFPVHFEPVCILIPRQGAPIMLVGPESDQYAMLVGQIPDVRILAEFTHPDEDYPFSRPMSLREIIGDAGWEIPSIRRVGLGGRGLIGADLLEAFNGALPRAEWIDAEEDLCSLRARKSKSEIDVIRHAYQIAEIGFQAALDVIDPGVTERAVAAEVDSAMR